MSCASYIRVRRRDGDGEVLFAGLVAPQMTACDLRHWRSMWGYKVARMEDSEKFHGKSMDFLAEPSELALSRRILFLRPANDEEKKSLPSPVENSIEISSSFSVLHCCSRLEDVSYDARELCLVKVMRGENLDFEFSRAGQWDRLERLFLHHCMLRELPNNLQHLPNLFEVDGRVNCVESVGRCSLQGSRLQRLTLSMNTVSVDMEPIWILLRDTQSLQHLCLSWTKAKKKSAAPPPTVVTASMRSSSGVQEEEAEEEDVKMMVDCRVDKLIEEAMEAAKKKLCFLPLTATAAATTTTTLSSSACNYEGRGCRKQSKLAPPPPPSSSSSSGSSFFLPKEKRRQRDHNNDDANNGKVRVEHLYHALLLNKTLISLDLSMIEISHDHVEPLCRVLRANTPLRQLSLRGTGLLQNEISQICQALASNVNLTSLDVGANLFGDSGAGDLARILPHVSLRHLVVNSCSIDDDGCQALLSRCQHLKSLNFSENNVRQKGYGALCKMLRQTATLTRLDAVLLYALVQNPKRLTEALKKNWSLVQGNFDVQSLEMENSLQRNRALRQKVRQSCATLLAFQRRCFIGKDLGLLVAKALYDTRADGEAWEKVLNQSVDTAVQPMEIGE